ncbi:MAG TPA: MobH family relaxase [Lamprocystis sp. (in: g-proteobacteria)]|nr:MobH family relaxase [Lamprocystis sp. (in: g-proteobacteria)]
MFQIPFMRRKTPAPAITAPAPIPVPVRPEIPRYPPLLQGLPLYARDEVQATQAELVRKLRYAVGCTPEQYDAWVLPVVERYTAYVHLLPASEAHHHRGAGGLLYHGLEVGFLAGQASAGKVFAMDREPKERIIHEPLWRLAATLAGLCHDIGKPLSDLSVTDRDGTVTWSPMQETIPAWAARHGLDSYYLHWRERRHNRHEAAGMMVLDRILGPETIARLYGADPAIMNALLDAVAGQHPDATLSVLVRNADAASVARDLKTNRIDPDAHSLGVPIERYLFDAMKRLVRDGTWQINTPGGRLWMLPGGLHIVWPQGGDEIVHLLAGDHIPGIPRHPDTLADILLERGSAVPPSTGDGVQRYWRQAPAPLARDGKPVELTMLRLADPGLILSGTAPATVALDGEPPARAVATVPVPASSGLDLDLLDSTDIDAYIDQVGWEEAPSAPDSEPIPPVPVKTASATDSEPLSAAPARPVGPPRPAPGPQRGRVGLAAMSPPLVASAPASPPEPGAAARQAAIAWFEAPARGAGGLLLLDLAASIHAGERQAADVLYQSALQVWVRVPAGLDGLGDGESMEDLIQSLWDGGLLTVDLMRPYILLRTLDGVRGVALTTDASSQFLALLPPGARPASQAPEAPVASPSAALPPRIDQPAPPAPVSDRPSATDTQTGTSAVPRRDETGLAAPRPRPTASTPSPSPTSPQTPGAVARELVATARRKYQASPVGSTGAGERVLTAADLAAAAAAARIKAASLRYALLARPGCNLTSDGGVSIACP